MKAVSTQDGFVYWGADDEEIVTKMRRAAFFDRHSTNRAFIRTVLNRLGDQIGSDAARLARASASDFLSALTRLELVSDVTERFTCPIFSRFCEQRDEKCDQGGCAFKVPR